MGAVDAFRENAPSEPDRSTLLQRPSDGWRALPNGVDSVKPGDYSGDCGQSQVRRDGEVRLAAAVPGVVKPNSRRLGAVETHRPRRPTLGEHAELPL